MAPMTSNHDVTGLDALAASLTPLGPTYAFHGRLLQTGLASTPKNYSALIWNLVQVLDKLERDVA